MKQTKEPKMTASPSRTNKTMAGAKDPTQVFMSMVMDMSWRLAIAFIAPIIIGLELDKHFKVDHLYLILGFIVGVSLGVMVVRRSYLEANKLTSNVGKDTKNAK